MTNFHFGDAWRYCENLDDPQAVRALVQAALLAAETIAFACNRVNPSDFATVPDWGAVQRDLRRALRLAGHPAGGSDQ